MAMYEIKQLEPPLLFSTHSSNKHLFEYIFLSYHLLKNIFQSRHVCDALRHFCGLFRAHISELRVNSLQIYHMTHGGKHSLIQSRTENGVELILTSEVLCLTADHSLFYCRYTELEPFNANIQSFSQMSSLPIQ